MPEEGAWPGDIGATPSAMASSDAIGRHAEISMVVAWPKWSTENPDSTGPSRFDVPTPSVITL